jgi:crossover junction endodeoxyribonuclease RuvC
MSARVLGIDIGSHGAIALLMPAGDLDGVVDLPIVRDGPKGCPNVSAALLADIVLKMQATMAYVAFVSARPAEGAVGAFVFGRSRGGVEGVCGAAGVPLSFLTPSNWKRLVGIPPGKEGAKDAVARLVRNGGAVTGSLFRSPEAKTAIPQNPRTPRTTPKLRIKRRKNAA